MVCNVYGARLFLEGHTGRMRGNGQVAVREIMIRHKEKLFPKKMVKHWSRLPVEVVESLFLVVLPFSRRKN